MRLVNNQDDSINIWQGLFLLFLGLKLCDKIDWSWWWVFSPIWIIFVFNCLLWLITKPYRRK